jgi:hypothetical protein
LKIAEYALLAWANQGSVRVGDPARLPVTRTPGLAGGVRRRRVSHESGLCRRGLARGPVTAARCLPVTRGSVSMRRLRGYQAESESESRARAEWPPARPGSRGPGGPGGPGPPRARDMYNDHVRFGPPSETQTQNTGTIVDIPSWHFA